MIDFDLIKPLGLLDKVLMQVIHNYKQRKLHVPISGQQEMNYDPASWNYEKGNKWKSIAEERMRNSS